MSVGGANVRVFFDGLFSAVRLDHPECVAIHPIDGSVWCGGEAGQIYRIDAAGREITQVASTGGFVLGIAFADQGETLVVMAHHAAPHPAENDHGADLGLDRAGDRGAAQRNVDDPAIMHRAVGQDQLRGVDAGHDALVRRSR